MSVLLSCVRLIPPRGLLLGTGSRLLARKGSPRANYRQTGWSRCRQTGYGGNRAALQAGVRRREFEVRALGSKKYEHRDRTRTTEGYRVRRPGLRAECFRRRRSNIPIRGGRHRIANPTLGDRVNGKRQAGHFFGKTVTSCRAKQSCRAKHRPLIVMVREGVPSTSFSKEPGKRRGWRASAHHDDERARRPSPNCPDLSVALSGPRSVSVLKKRSFQPKRLGKQATYGDPAAPMPPTAALRRNFSTDTGLPQVAGRA